MRINLLIEDDIAQKVAKMYMCIFILINIQIILVLTVCYVIVNYNTEN